MGVYSAMPQGHCAGLLHLIKRKNIRSTNSREVFTTSRNNDGLFLQIILPRAALLPLVPATTHGQLHPSVDLLVFVWVAARRPSAKQPHSRVHREVDTVSRGEFMSPLLLTHQTNAVGGSLLYLVMRWREPIACCIWQSDTQYSLFLCSAPLHP